MISNVMLLITAVLLFGTISALILYYRRLIFLRQEYRKAKGIIEDVILNFDSQLDRQKERILIVAKQIAEFLVENKVNSKKIEEYDGRIIDLTQEISDVPNIKKRVFFELKEMYNEIENIKENQDKIMKKIVEIKKIKPRVSASDEKINSAIPIKKEKALEPLTETELSILEMIKKDGEKTAPEIRGMIDLTREHTARLMKKLYKNGYLERDTHKMPYVYRLKEEMEKILKKREPIDS